MWWFVSADKLGFAFRLVKADILGNVTVSFDVHIYLLGLVLIKKILWINRKRLIVNLSISYKLSEIVHPVYVCKVAVLARTRTVHCQLFCCFE